MNTRRLIPSAVLLLAVSAGYSPVSKELLPRSKIPLTPAPSGLQLPTTGSL